MTPLDFIAAVVPSAGYLCIAELSTKKKQHVFVQDVKEFAPALDEFNAKNFDTYFALGSFVESGSRTISNALYMRSCFMDIDCGEGKAYPSKQAAATALDEFLQKTELGILGNPWVVSSGGGLHVYWPFTDNVPIKEWRNAAEALKLLCKKHALAIDYTVTADAARVLRVTVHEMPRSTSPAMTPMKTPSTSPCRARARFQKSMWSSPQARRSSMGHPLSPSAAIERAPA